MSKRSSLERPPPPSTHRVSFAKSNPERWWIWVSSMVKLSGRVPLLPYPDHASTSNHDGRLEQDTGESRRAQPRPVCEQVRQGIQFEHAGDKGASRSDCARRHHRAAPGSALPSCPHRAVAHTTQNIKTSRPASMPFVRPTSPCSSSSPYVVPFLTYL